MKTNVQMVMKEIKNVPNWVKSAALGVIILLIILLIKAVFQLNNEIFFIPGVVFFTAFSLYMIFLLIGVFKKSKYK